MAPEYFYELYRLVQQRMAELQASLANPQIEVWEQQKQLGQQAVLRELQEFLGQYRAKLPKRLRDKFGE
ncbi:MAG: hypothetical protein A2557_02080 [Candidatus Lambdaproteobacteria bacterium RIFOXYD2_FULL_56_26]|uniref:Uncharacterized protein n=1 Tax=Candidatus Lambdaproteobacteria bacterium RIFOXYD2_FULL_56_26 TaxID=1817773 RepID=A0A1F6H2A0_9PROT|nr:MAG: hypothetical protein A2426_00220 [Candidatus Lambdaproteobacteria bacterium RIFOXYC1_FULL_56_13]OGH04501.1 MAG: hypothetical protein A2557_02080 [Candidatus Lambdaproteobacteria bacterium RIFOXYD2_FULL_56_26]